MGIFVVPRPEVQELKIEEKKKKNDEAQIGETTNKSGGRSTKNKFGSSSNKQCDLSIETSEKDGS